MNTFAPWLAAAQKDLGLQEIPGAKTAPAIARWLAAAKLWWADDETPWCGLACWAWFSACGIAAPKAFYRAKSWADWGQPVIPCIGAVAVFWRDGGGHVGILAGKTAAGNWVVLGGNQRNGVRYSEFLPGRAIATRWPLTSPLVMAALPIMAASGPLSTNEA